MPEIEDHDLGMPIVVMCVGFAILYRWTVFNDPVLWGTAVATISTGVGWLFTRDTIRGRQQD